MEDPAGWDRITALLAKALDSGAGADSIWQTLEAEGFVVADLPREEGVELLRTAVCAPERPGPSRAATATAMLRGAGYTTPAAGLPASRP